MPMCTYGLLYSLGTATSYRWVVHDDLCEGYIGTPHHTRWHDNHGKTDHGDVSENKITNDAKPSTARWAVVTATRDLPTSIHASTPLFGLDPHPKCGHTHTHTHAHTHAHKEDHLPQRCDLSGNQQSPGGVEMRLFCAVTPLKELYEQLREYRPTHIVGYSTVVAGLAKRACHDETPWPHPRPRRVCANSEPLTAQGRAHILRAWGVVVTNQWGSTELNSVCGVSSHRVMTCPDVNPTPPDHGANSVIGDSGVYGANNVDGSRQGDRDQPVTSAKETSDDLLILQEDMVLFEKAPGNKLYVTVLMSDSPAQPLIRYLMDDVVEVVEPPVSGAHPFRSIRSIAGRNDALFDYDGVLVQAVYFYSILLVHKSIAESQIRQTPYGCSIHVVQEHGEDKPDTSLVKQAVEEMLTGKGIAQAHVTVIVVEGIPKHPETHKVQRFIPLPKGSRGKARN